MGLIIVSQTADTAAIPSEVRNILIFVSSGAGNEQGEANYKRAMS